MCRVGCLIRHKSWIYLILNTPKKTQDVYCEKAHAAALYQCLVRHQSGPGEKINEAHRRFRFFFPVLFFQQIYVQLLLRQQCKYYIKNPFISSTWQYNARNCHSKKEQVSQTRIQRPISCENLWEFACPLSEKSRNVATVPREEKVIFVIWLFLYFISLYSPP